MTVSDIYEFVKENELEKVEPQEIRKQYYAFCNEYIDNMFKDDNDKNNAVSELFANITYEYSKQGFIAGYKAAMSLLADATKVR